MKKVFWLVLAIAAYYNTGAIWIHETAPILCTEPHTFWQHFKAGGWDIMSYLSTAMHCPHPVEIAGVFMINTFWLAGFIFWCLSWVAFGAVWLSSWILYGIFGGIGLWIVGT